MSIRDKFSTERNILLDNYLLIDGYLTLLLALGVYRCFLHVVNTKIFAYKVN